MSSLVLVIAVFLASAVEMVEALTIVIAAGTSRSWRSAIEGTLAGVLLLAILVATIGPALIHYVPLAFLRFIIGALLLVFGLQWLRKAILRSSGLKAMHNEDEVFAKEVSKLKGLSTPIKNRDATAFTVAFKGVFLEGLEVVIVVLTLGISNHKLALAALAALAAVVLVALAGVVLSKQLSNVPENAMKMGVGLMLVSFGTFWSGEGLGVGWPFADGSIPLLVLVYGAVSYGIIKVLAKQYQLSLSRES